MATNKNALIRYKHLDMLLSDRHHYYDINDLTKRVNDKLYDDGFKTVTRRCIEKDLVYLTEAPFHAPIKHFKWNGKNCVAYKNASFSIFKQEMSNEERTLLREVLNTIGQFEEVIKGNIIGGRHNGSDMLSNSVLLQPDCCELCQGEYVLPLYANTLLG